MENNSLSTKILATVGELCVIASLFPYQITVNRKEKSFGMRSILLNVKSEKTVNEEGKSSRSWQFNMPGFAFREAMSELEKKLPKKEKKKKLVLREKYKRSQNKSED